MAKSDARSAPTLSDEEIKGFETAILFGEPFRHTYTYFEGRLIVLFGSPWKKEVDLLLSWLDSQQRQGTSKAQLLRFSRTLRIRSYLLSLKTPVLDLSFEPISVMLEEDQAEEHLVRGLIRSLDFTNETLYNVLEELASDFGRRLAALSGFALPGEEGPMTLEQFVLKARKNPKFWKEKPDASST